MKAVYTFLTYPDSENLDSVGLVQSMVALGWDYAKSPLHDKDVKEDGTPKKPHYHWLVGFPSKPPKPSDFIAFIKKFGAVGAPSALVVKDPQGAVEYFTHKNHPNKYQYSSDDSYFSEFWDVEKYTTQEQARRKKKALKDVEKQADLETIAKIISEIGCRDDQINSFAKLVKYATHNGCLQLVLDRCYFFKTYLDSYLQDHRKQATLEHQNDDLQAQLNAVTKENEDLSERLQFAEQSATLYYSQLYGEDPPASFEW